MNTNLETFYNIVGIVLWLTALPALWISGRITQRNPIYADRWTQLFLWIVLGGLFRIPLVDLLRELANVIAQVIPSEPNMAGLPVRVGIMGSIVKLLIYGLGIIFAERVMAKRNILFLKELILRPWERGFIVLGMAGLMYHLIGDLIGNFILVTFSGTGS